MSEPREEYKKPSLCEKIDEYIRRVDSPETESKQEYIYLKRLYEKLIKLDIEPALKERLLRLEDLFAKYGNKDVSGQVQLNGEDMIKGGFDLG